MENEIIKVTRKYYRGINIKYMQDIYLKQQNIAERSTEKER